MVSYQTISNLCSSSANMVVHARRQNKSYWALGLWMWATRWRLGTSSSYVCPQVAFMWATRWRLGTSSSYVCPQVAFMWATRWRLGTSSSYVCPQVAFMWATRWRLGTSSSYVCPQVAFTWATRWRLGTSRFSFLPCPPGCTIQSPGARQCLLVVGPFVGTLASRSCLR